MMRGPTPNQARNGEDLTMLEKARAAWGDETPDWIEELARLADELGLKSAGKRIGYSASTVSEVLRGVFRGSIQRVEQKVRGALMGVVVECPMLGEIGRDQCLDWQKRKFAATNAMRMQVYHACRSGCRNARLDGGDDA